MLCRAGIHDLYFHDLRRGYCQVDKNRCGRPTRYCGRSPSWADMLGIRIGLMPQLDSAGYLPLRDKGIQFRSPHRELTDMVKKELQSGHAIIPDVHGISHSLQITDAPYLLSSLAGLGLSADKSQRRFPDYVPDDSMPHFLCGVIDHKDQIYPKNSF